MNIETILVSVFISITINWIVTISLVRYLLDNVLKDIEKLNNEYRDDLLSISVDGIRAAKRWRREPTVPVNTEGE